MVTGASKIFCLAFAGLLAFPLLAQDLEETPHQVTLTGQVAFARAKPKVAKGVKKKKQIAHEKPFGAEIYILKESDNAEAYQKKYRYKAITDSTGAWKVKVKPDTYVFVMQYFDFGEKAITTISFTWEVSDRKEIQVIPTIEIADQKEIR
jgi:hypothetical protein